VQLNEMQPSAVFLILTAAAVGCGGSTSSNTELLRDTIVAAPVALIGEAEGDAAYLFGDVSSVAVGAETILVADRLGSTVRGYDLNGRYVGTIGSQGDGPGEFEFPNDMAFDSLDRLYVRDYRRISVFERRARRALPDSLVATIPLAGPGTPWSVRGRIVAGLYYRPTYRYRDGERQSYYYTLHDSLGPTGDTLTVPRLRNMEHLGRASYLISPDLGRNLTGVNRAPFEPTAGWDLTAHGTLVVSPGDEGVVLELSPANDTLRVVAFAEVATEVDGREYNDSIAAFQFRIDSIPVPLDQVRGMSEAARTRRLPRTLPFALALHVDDIGNIWIRRWPPPGRPGQSVFDVIRRTDDRIDTVIIDADLQLDPPPFVSPGYIAGVVVDAETAVERVALYRLPKQLGSTLGR
jgi:hypothetical protein